mmetsp:Transcript_6460/g.18189  ORF Transcript_6460/g.18189 Transcript_6460/m.18189 type:complete len:156 (+) Transcript_6460:911-1378(+)
MLRKQHTQANGRLTESRTQKLITHGGQSYALILGQCTTNLKEKMKQDPQWDSVTKSYNPLKLYSLIERTIIGHTDDQYPCTVVYEQEAAFYNHRQEQFTNSEWHERFNKRVDIANSVGDTHQHEALMKFFAKETHDGAFEDLSDDEQEMSERMHM